MPVLDLARQAIKKYAILPDNIEISFYPHDDGCDSSLATIAVMESFYKENCVHAILGPSCEYPTGKCKALIILTAGENSRFSMLYKIIIMQLCTYV